ncbi:MAG: sulfatase, partial [Candidatus Sumerlaeota bacterium]
NWSCSDVFDYLGPLETVNAPTACYLWANRNRKSLDDWNCRKLFDSASEFLRDNARRKNFFLWLDSFDPHEPWDAPPEFVKMYDQDDDYDGHIDPRAICNLWSDDHSDAGVRRIRAWYEAKVSWLDDNIGRLLDTLEATGLEKNTAVILTADHGTRLHEYGRFGKATPVRETEAHVPMMVALPDGPTGRLSAIVQPQDIFATACRMARCKAPGSIDSYDMLEIQEEAPPRDIALAGMRLKFSDGESPLATACDGKWCADLTVDPAQSQLRILGRTENVAPRHPEVMERLWESTIHELLRRNMDPRLEAWIRSHGNGPVPHGARMMEVAPPPPGYRQYFMNLRELGPQKVHER